MSLKIIKIFAVLCVLVFLSPFPALAGEGESAVPRFVSLGSDRVYVRSGPALRYPIKWVFQREGLPVEVLQEFEGWRKIRGMDGEEGWIHQSLLSGDRHVVVKEGGAPVPVRAGAGQDFRMIAKIEPQVVAVLDKCEGAWCRIEAGGYRGWVERNFLWGIYDSEYLN